MRFGGLRMVDIPEIVIWAVVLAVIIQGFSMALLVYLMYQRQKERKKEVPPPPPPEEPPGKESEETP
jgi:hypothetical protein